MKILLISHQLDYSGAPIALLHLANALVELGCDVDVASLNGGPLKTDFELAGAKTITSIVKKYDLIILNTIITSFLAEKLVSNSKKIILWLHESPSFKNYSPKLDYQTINFSNIDLVMGVASFQVEYIKSMAKGKPCIRFDNTYGNNKNYTPERKYNIKDKYNVLLIGSYEKRKGYYKFFQTNNTLNNPNHQIIFNIVGVDKYSFDKHSLNPKYNVKFYDKMNRNQIMEFIEASDVFMSLSEDEVKPLTIIESINKGTPCVVSKIPAHVELETEHEFIKCHDNPLEFIFSQDFSEWYKLLESSKNKLDLYSWESFLKRTQNLLST